MNQSTTEREHPTECGRKLTREYQWHECDNGDTKDNQNQTNQSIQTRSQWRRDNESSDAKYEKNWSRIEIYMLEKYEHHIYKCTEKNSPSIDQRSGKNEQTQ